MNRSSTAALCALLLALPAALTAAPVLARASNGYLSWAGKTNVAPPAPVQQVHTTAGDYAVPPSPYGQVGDPYPRAPALRAPGLRTLGWPEKLRTQQTPPQQVAYSQPPRSQSVQVTPMQAAPVQAAPMPATSYMVMPHEAAAPRHAPSAPLGDTPTYSPAPQALPPQSPLPQARIDRADPGADDDAGGVNERAPERVTTHATAPQPAPVQAAEAANTGDYHVPSSSPYAARIAAARAAQEHDRVAQVQAQADAQAKTRAQAEQSPAPVKSVKSAGKSKAPVATAPAPTIPLAAAEIDHVFVPGQHYTSAADEPRVYSLHRQYGLTPDPITVDPHPTGALLGDAVTLDDPADPASADDSDDRQDAAAAKAHQTATQKSDH